MSHLALSILTFIFADNVPLIRGEAPSSPGNIAAEDHYSTGAISALSVATAVVCLVTVIENGIVLAAFKVEKLYRIPQNYYIVSLVLADMLTAVLSMPLYTQYTLTGSWMLEEWTCDLFLATDWTLRVASLYLRVLITIDKYFTVKFPTKYMLWRTKNKVLGLISSAWLVPAITFYIYVLAWRRSKYNRFQLNHSCDMPFTREGLLSFYLALIYFWPTLILIGTLYACLYKIAYTTQMQYEMFRRSLIMNCQRPFRGDADSVNANNPISLKYFLDPRPIKPPKDKTNSYLGTDAHAATLETNVDSPGSTPRFSRRLSIRNREIGDSGREVRTHNMRQCAARNAVFRPRPDPDVNDYSLDLIPCRLRPDPPEIPRLIQRSGATCDIQPELDITELHTKTESDPSSGDEEYRKTRYQLSCKKRLDQDPCRLCIDVNTEQSVSGGCGLKGSEDDNLMSGEEDNLMSGEDTPDAEANNRDDDAMETISEESSIPFSPLEKSVPTGLKEKSVPSSPNENSELSEVSSPEPLFSSTPREPRGSFSSTVQEPRGSFSSTAQEPRGSFSIQAECFEQFVRAHRSSEGPSARYVNTQDERRQSGGGRYPIYLHGVNRRISSGCFPLSGQSKKMAFHAIKAISSLLTAFVCCWLPFQVVVIANAFWPGLVNETLYEFTFWLIYLNSFFNPFCYNYAIEERRSMWRRIAKCFRKK